MVWLGSTCIDRLYLSHREKKGKEKGKEGGGLGEGRKGRVEATIEIFVRNKLRKLVQWAHKV